MRVFMLAVLVVSASAMFMGPEPPMTSTAGSQAAGGSNSLAIIQALKGLPPATMPVVLNVIRQILKLVLSDPKLLASMTGNQAAPGQPQPALGMGGPQNPTNPLGSANPFGSTNLFGSANPLGNMNPMGLVNSMQGYNPTNPYQNSPGMGGYPGSSAGHAHTPMSSSDAVKDMQMLELLRDPRLGFSRDYYISPYLNHRGPYRPSMPDGIKDYIKDKLTHRIMRRGGYTPKEHQLIRFIGDPIEMMPHVFGAGSRVRPM